MPEFVIKIIQIVVYFIVNIISIKIIEIVVYCITLLFNINELLALVCEEKR